LSLLDDESFLTDLDSELSSRAIAQMHGIKSKSTVNEYRAKRRAQIAAMPITPEKPAAGESEEHRPDGSADYTRFSETPWGYEDHRDFIRTKGQDPDKVTFTWGLTTRPGGGFWNKLNNVRPKGASDGGEPLWPVIQQAAPVVVTPAPAAFTVPAVDGLKLALKCADTQIGFRLLPDGTLDPFHDEQAMRLFIEVCRAYQPNKIQILGDFLDLASQGRFAQEAAFANTTQLAFNAGHQFLAELRAACPDAEIIIIEGNHDKRMQNYVEANSVAAFGLKQANMPDSWPVMSLPFLLRLGELDIKYVEAYPAATDWDNDQTRNIHGTRANSKGSTMGQYVHELPHINTWAGHTHRAEIVYRTVIGPRGEAIESYAANPGCLALTDGSVPSVHGSIGSDGRPAKVVEDWQQGLGVLYYNDTEDWPNVYRIRNGAVVIGTTRIAV